MRIWSGAQIKLCYSNMFHLRRTWRLLRSPFLRLRCSGDGALQMDGSWANTMTAWMPSIFGRVSCTRQNDDVWCPVPGTTFWGRRCTLLVSRS